MISEALSGEHRDLGAVVIESLIGHQKNDLVLVTRRVERNDILANNGVFRHDMLESDVVEQRLGARCTDYILPKALH